jgi:uncharacterized protein (DUF2164 family)
MAARSQDSPMKVRLSAERRAALLAALTDYYAGEFDDELSAFRAERLLDFFLRALGPAVYNQGVRDAAAFVQSKLADIEGEVYERE